MILPQRATPYAARVRAAVVRARRQGHVPRPPAPMTPPTAAMRAYAARLTTMVQAAVVEAYKPLLADLPALVAQAREERGDAAGWRADASRSGRSASAAVASAGAASSRSLSAKRAAASASAAAADAGAHVQAELGRQVKDVLGIDLMPDSKARARVAAFVHENVKLITGISPTLAAEVESLLLAGLSGGQLHEMLALAIKSKLKIAINRAELIAVDQLGKLTGQIAAARAQDLGATHFYWRTAEDERVRGNPAGKYPRALPSHYARNGQRYAYADPPKGKNGESELPGVPIRCRCYGEPDLTTAPGFEGVAEEAAAITGSPEDLEAEAERLRLEVEAMLAGQPAPVARPASIAPVISLTAAREAKAREAEEARIANEKFMAAEEARERFNLEVQAQVDAGMDRRAAVLAVKRARMLAAGGETAAQAQAQMAYEARRVATPPPAPWEQPTNSTPSLAEIATGAFKSREALGGGVNSTMRVMLKAADGSTSAVVWKPVSGERPLLRDGVQAGTYYKREAAAYAVAEALGVKDLIPPTAARELPDVTGAMEMGSVQAFADAAKEVPAGMEIDRRAVERMRVFDFIIGNTDRHSGNVMWRTRADGRVEPVMIDHGLSLPVTDLELFRQPELKNQAMPIGPLSRETVAEVKKFNEREIVDALKASDIEPLAIERALRRLYLLKQDPGILDIEERTEASMQRIADRANELVPPEVRVSIRKMVSE